MKINQIEQDLTLLAEWAPGVLAQGENASLADLYEIIQRRARVERAVLDCPKHFVAPLLVRVIKTDQRLRKDFYTLLYLPRERAALAAGSAGCELSEIAAWGVHSFSISKVLNSWAIDLHERSGVDVHPAELLRAYDRLAEARGSLYTNEKFSTDSGFRSHLEPEEYERLIGYIHK